MSRKRIKSGSYSNCNVRIAKKSNSSQLEWAAVVGSASKWLSILVCIFRVYEFVKPFIVQQCSG